MSTIDRFKEIVESGIIFDADDIESPLSPQMKYDFLAAINSMQQIETLKEEISNRKGYRAKLKVELLKSCNQSLKKIADDSENFNLKKIEETIRMLKECRREIIKIDSADRECDKLFKYIRKGVSA